MNKTYAILSIVAALVLGAAPAIELSQTVGTAVSPTVIKLTKAQVKEIQQSEREKMGEKAKTREDVKKSPRLLKETKEKKEEESCGDGVCAPSERGCGANPAANANKPSCQWCQKDCPAPPGATR